MTGKKARRFIGRNDRCPCGSGKKYKHCCLKRDNDQKYIAGSNSPADEALQLLNSESESDLLKAIELLKTQVDSARDEDSRTTNALTLARAYQRRGLHNAAIDVLGTLPDEGINGLVRLHLIAVSKTALGDHLAAMDLYETVLGHKSFSVADAGLRADMFLQAGKTFSLAHKLPRAQELWHHALSLFEEFGDRGGAARAQANIASILLNHPDPLKQAGGIQILENSSAVKAELGDAEGLANNYSLLALHYWKCKRYGRALAYMRRDLKLTRSFGDLSALCITLSNLGGLYIDLKQLGPARAVLNEALEISNRLKDGNGAAIATYNLDVLEKAAQVTGMAGEVIGPKALCACGSHQEYQACCGGADSEPSEFNFSFNVSADAKEVIKNLSERNIEASTLDFILRSTGQSEKRLSWTRVKSRDGWFELHELPDMAHYLTSAEELCRAAEKDIDSLHIPLTTLIISVCALEAFINQVAFFLCDLSKSGRLHLNDLPDKLRPGALEFQRRIDLTTKWEVIGGFLCGVSWPVQPWPDAKTLIEIRNELVHFKSTEYEQIVPKPKLDTDLMRRIPKNIETRNVERSWPYRLLTASLAKWACGTAGSSIRAFKSAYAEAREASKNGGPTPLHS